MFTPSEFIECLGKISIARSVKGHLYKDLKLIGNRIDGIRCDTKKHFKLSIEELYCAYEKGVSTTTEMRNYIKGWAYSPALAILNEVYKLEAQVEGLKKVER